MQATRIKRNLSYGYLLFVPLLTFILAMVVGHISYKIYIPVWLANIVLMILGTRILAPRIFKNQDEGKKQIGIGAFCLVIPVLIVSMFFGLGPPPDTPAGWVATVTEQQVRFIMLIISGIFFTVGFAVLRESLKGSSGNLFCTIGLTAIMIAIPLFIFNMIFWAAYLPQLFKTMTASGLDKTPEWFKPIAFEFNLLTVVEVAIRYLGVAAFVIAIYRGGWFRKNPSIIYIAICLVEFAIAVFPQAPKLFPVPFFIVTIPANPFIVGYYIGINLIRSAGP